MGERKSFHFSEKVLFQFISVPLQGILQCTKSGFVFVAVNPSDVKNSFNSSKGGNASDSFCVYIAEYILHIRDMNFSV